MKNKIASRIFFTCMLLLFFVFPIKVEAQSPWQADKNTIYDIIVDIRTENGKNLPLPVKRRMENSVKPIAIELLQGKKVNVIENEKQSYEEILGAVFDKILIGYSVAKVEISFDKKAHSAVASIKLLPWQETIGEVEIDTVIEGMPKNIEKILRKDLKGIEKVFQEALLGLPTAASDWTNGILKREVEQFIEKHLPECRADFLLTAGKKTKVKLLIYPRLPVIRTLDLFLRSKTILNLALLNERDFFLQELNTLLGVPVAFVKRHEKDITHDFSTYFNENPHFKPLALKTTLKLVGKENMQAYATLDSKTYRLRLEGFLDIQSGKNEKGTSFRLYTGKKISKKDEVFLETYMFPQEFSFHLGVGMERRFLKKIRGAILYSLTEHFRKYSLSYDFDDRLQLKNSYKSDDVPRETSLCYRLHDFLSIEAIHTKDRKWLRLIGDF